MSNKTPKKIWIGRYTMEQAEKTKGMIGKFSTMKKDVLGVKPIKYLSEEHFNSLIEEKDKEIERFFEWVDEEEIPRFGDTWIKYFDNKDNFLTTKELYNFYKIKSMQ